ncbi:MAG: hypothetical protein AAGE52_11985 [Myxococcota bacterium]
MRAERLAIAARKSGDTRDAPPPDSGEVATHLSHAAFVAHDVALARSLGSRSRTIESADGRIGEQLCRAMEGKAITVVEGAVTSREVFDTALLRVFAADLADEADALKLARRATRIARTEGDLDAISIAGVQLARRRRIEGFPHLALRILTKLEAHSPNRWDAWVAWEKLFAGGAVEAKRRETPAWESVRALEAMLRSGSWSGPIPAWRPWARDLRRLEEALGTRACTELCAWAEGRVAQTPFGLSGLAAVPPKEPVAWVVSDAAGSRRRLRRGSPPNALVVANAPRVDAAISELLLRAGEPVPVPAFFATLYGFEFVPSRHRATFDVLIHRVRECLPSTARLDRSESVVLQLDAPLASIDPRTVRNAEDLLLAAIAQRDAATARELADAMGLPLRSVQRSLRELAQAGQCLVQGRGASTRYVVEDTTFTNPTGLGA